jgi:hypothetical protein
MAFCENCGQIISQTTRFCSTCGEKVKHFKGSTNVVDYTPKDANYSKSSLFKNIVRTNIYFLAIIILIFLNGMIVFYVIFHPGLILSYYRLSCYYYDPDTKTLISFIIFFDLMAIVLNYKNIFLSILFILDIVYMVGLYYFPDSYFTYGENYYFNLNYVSLVCTITLILLNLFALYKYINNFFVNKDLIKHQIIKKKIEIPTPYIKQKDRDGAGIR